MIKKSKQDDHYLAQEGDDFFQRNFAGVEPPELRENKKPILQQMLSLGAPIGRVLEYGCNYGDLLAFLKKRHGGTQCVGVEASGKAIEFGRAQYGSAVELHRGTIADNPVNSDDRLNGHFDWVLVDDVFGWVSRETLLQSIANIDGALKEGGHLFIRDFYPNGRVRNANHHVKGGFVFNHKIPGSHAKIFTDTGIYEIVSQTIFVDTTRMSGTYKSKREFESRWADTILKKSYSSYYSD